MLLTSTRAQGLVEIWIYAQLHARRAAGLVVASPCQLRAQTNYLTFLYSSRPPQGTMVYVTSRCPFGPVPLRGAGRPVHER